MLCKCLCVISSYNALLSESKLGQGYSLPTHGKDYARNILRPSGEDGEDDCSEVKRVELEEGGSE